MPARGDIAICSQGHLGLITSDGPVPVTYANGHSVGKELNGVQAEAWVGIHLSPPVGRPWSSRSPYVVGRLRDVLIDLWVSQPALDGVEKAFGAATR